MLANLDDSIPLKWYDGTKSLPPRDHVNIAGLINNSEDEIKLTVDMIGRCAGELATLYTSLEGQDDAQATVNDVHVCMTREEALYAKSRELCAHYETLVKASRTLAECVNALNAVILPSDEETRVRAPVNDTDACDKDATQVINVNYVDPNFNADALRREMETEFLKAKEQGDRDYQELMKGELKKRQWWRWL